MRAAFEVAERLTRLIEAKDPVDDRPESGRRNRAVHRLEHRVGADVDGLYARALAHERDQIDFDFRTGEQSDERDRSAHAGGGDPFLQRARGVDDEVRATIGKIHDPLRPVAVVQRNRAQLQHDLFRPGSEQGPLGIGERVDAEWRPDLENTHQSIVPARSRMQAADEGNIISCLLRWMSGYRYPDQLVPCLAFRGRLREATARDLLPCTCTFTRTRTRTFSPLLSPICRGGAHIRASAVRGRAREQGWPKQTAFPCCSSGALPRRMPSARRRWPRSPTARCATSPRAPSRTSTPWASAAAIAWPSCWQTARSWRRPSSPSPRGRPWRP